MSIKLTKMYTIRYIQGPTITSRRVSGISSTWTWTSESGGAWVLAIDEFSRHEAGELIVANRHGRWIRNLSKITSQLSAFKCGRTGNQYVVSLSSPRCHVHHVYRVYSSFITYQWCHYMPLYATESDPQRRVSQYNKLTSPESRCKWIHDSGQKKVFQNRVLRGRIHVVNRMIDNWTTYTKYRT